MAFIFLLSNSTGQVSGIKSYEASDVVMNSYAKVFSGELNKEKVNQILRKNAHGVEYLVLALLVSNAVFLNLKKGKASIVDILFVCLFYAVTDEFHQSFVPGRTSRVSDILIDFLGAVIGMGIYYFFYYKLYTEIIKRRIR